MYKYLTNQYRKLPLFGEFNFYYNLPTKETKREIKEGSKTDSSLTITEVVLDRTTSIKATTEYEYQIDKNAKTYMFFISKAMFLSIIVLGIFCNLLYEFYDIVKINKALTMISFIVGATLLASVIVAISHIISVAYFSKKPNLKILNNFQYLQYIGYAIMLLLFIAFYLIGNEKSTYVYTCIVMLGTFSFYTYVIHLYLLLPLRLIINKKLKFYRNVQDNAIILVEIEEK